MVRVGERGFGGAGDRCGLEPDSPAAARGPECGAHSGFEIGIQISPSQARECRRADCERAGHAGGMEIGTGHQTAVGLSPRFAHSCWRGAGHIRVCRIGPDV